MSERKTLTKRQRRDVLFMQKGQCAGCGGEINLAKGDAFEIDHATPLAVGGSNDWRNLQALCPDCHAGKTRGDVAMIAKTRRVAAKHAGTWSKRKRIIPGSKAHFLKRKISGKTVRRGADHG